MGYIKGIDISNNNGNIDFSQVSNDKVEYVYMKASEGKTFQDSKLDAFYNSCKSNGLKVGAYHFLTYTSSPEAQAENFYKKIRAYEWELIPMLDIETEFNGLCDYVIRFINAFKELSPLQLGIYSYTGFINNLEDIQNIIKDYHLICFFVSLQYNLGYNKNILVWNLLDKELIPMHIEEDKMFTIDEYEKLQHKYKYNIEFINGDVVLHSKTSVKHNEIVNNIQFKLMSYLANSKCKVYTEQIELKFHNDKDNINVFPDVFVMCEDAKKNGESFVSPPKVIFEVVSPNYSGHDYITKLQIYQRYGVLEYVIVEQTGEMIQYNLVDGIFKPSINDYYSSNIFEGLVITTEEILK